MIVVFVLVSVFLWGYLKKFPNPNRLKMILAVTVFSILVSFLVSFVSVSGVYGVYDTDNFKVVWARHNPVLGRFSLPFHLEVEWGWMEFMFNTGTVWFRIFFAGAQVLEMKFSYKSAGETGYVFPNGQINVNYTATLFYHLLLIFTALNMIGLPLAILTYNMRGILKKLNSRITELKEHYKDNSLYQWLFSD